MRRFSGKALLENTGIHLMILYILINHFFVAVKVFKLNLFQRFHAIRKELRSAYTSVFYLNFVFFKFLLREKKVSKKFLRRKRKTIDCKSQFQ